MGIASTHGFFIGGRREPPNNTTDLDIHMFLIKRKRVKILLPSDMPLLLVIKDVKLLRVLKYNFWLNFLILCWFTVHYDNCLSMTELLFAKQWIVCFCNYQYFTMWSYCIAFSKIHNNYYECIYLLFRYVNAMSDRVTVIFSTVFQDYSDIVIGKVFMQVWMIARLNTFIQGFINL